MTVKIQPVNCIAWQLMHGRGERFTVVVAHQFLITGWGRVIGLRHEHSRSVAFATPGAAQIAALDLTTNREAEGYRLYIKPYQLTVDPDDVPNSINLADTIFNHGKPV
jgi:hypothetical protein